MKFRMIDLGQISSNAPQTNVFIKLIIHLLSKCSGNTLIRQLKNQLAGKNLSDTIKPVKKSAGRLKCIRYLPGGQVPNFFYFVP